MTPPEPISASSGWAKTTMARSGTSVTIVSFRASLGMPRIVSCPRQLSFSLRREPADRGHHLIGFDRLAQMHLKPRGQNPSLTVWPDVSGQGDGGEGAAALAFAGPQRAHQREAVLAGHSDVAHDHVRPHGVDG